MVSDLDSEKNSSRNDLIVDYVERIFCNADAFEPLLVQFYTFMNVRKMFKCFSNHIHRKEH